MSINITSEIKPLKKVLLHRPAGELLNLTPDTLSELLFDDIPFLKKAQEEHDCFAETLRNLGVEVVYLEDLMSEVISISQDIREAFIRQFINEADVHTNTNKEIIFEYLNAIKEPKQLVLKTMEGLKSTEVTLSTFNSLMDTVRQESEMLIKPMPNLYFTRDSFACISQGVSLNHMYSVTRNRETIYGEYIFKYHPDYYNTPLFYDRYWKYHIEGGDISNLSEETLLVGLSQRTEANALEILARNIFSSHNNRIKEVIALSIPRTRAFMHLDTVFTQVDYDTFTVHPEILSIFEIYSIKPDDNDIKIRRIDDSIENVLADRLHVPAVKMIKCGGNDRIVAAREQWNDASNTLCIKPKTVIVYDRNEVTNDLLVKNGIDLITIPSAEISRGRGGPRCMSMPLLRED